MENGPECEDSDESKTIEERCETDEIAKKRIRLPRQSVQLKKFCLKEERSASLKKVSIILQKSEHERSLEENQILQECADTVQEIKERRRKRDEAKKRLEEFEDPEDVLNEKCLRLAQAIAQSRHLVVYTGAGISTAAKIPDYRGPNGIWTRIKEGREIGDHDLSLAEPTYTHMALSELYRQNILKYVVSQNCDGLHLRSGLPRTALSELHGNMYVEVCKTCKPHKEYWRLFDVTENTARFAHKTYRRCYTCNGPLVDTIVHFGERGSLQWPLNWKGACKNAKEATTILCLGSSLKVLKKYPWLWQMDKPAKKRPNLYIVNLQWTPKDDCANVKINGRCDRIMKKIMDILDINVPKYEKVQDPIFAHATAMHDSELHTTTQPFLKAVKDEETEVQNDHNCSSSNNGSSPADLSHRRDIDAVPANCDNSIETLRLPVKQEIVPNVTNFSIDSILQRAEKPTLTSFLAQNLSYLSYNLFQQQVSEFFLYPYQTSLLYSGLHSIINPAVYSDIVPVKVEGFETVAPSCEYCDKHFRSNTCLFYLKTDAEFFNPIFRYSKLESKEKLNSCICCDYDTEEDEVTEDGGDSKEHCRTQPGWFGKGYKKGRKLKRKVTEK